MAVSARTDLPPYDGIGLPDHEADVLAKYARTDYGHCMASNTVLEVGSWLGRSTIAMAQVGATVVSVDPHIGPPVRPEGPTANEFLENLRRFGVADRVVPIMADFGSVAKLLRAGAFDMAFIDGAHDGVSVIRDGKAASLLLRAGSPILFHDYDVHVGVTSAVHELAKQWRQKPEVLKGTSLALLWKRI